MRVSGRQVGAWAFVVGASLAVTWLFGRLGVPSPALFAALNVSIAFALLHRGAPVQLNRTGSVGGQALIGISMGNLLSFDTMKELVGNAAPIAFTALATLALSIVVGEVFSRLGRIDRPTGAFSMIAGGASGITAIAHELGADPRITTVVQYLRVVMVVLGMPVVAAVVFSPESTGAVYKDPTSAGLPLDLTFTLVSAALGVGLARLVRMPSGSLLGPLFVAGAISLTGVMGPVTQPELLTSLGLLLVGWQVGLRFTRADLRRVGRLLPLATALIVVIVAACAGLGVILSAWTGMPLLDTYLATTPGGLFAVLPLAAEYGSDVTFVLAVQVIRLVLLLAVAPFIAQWYRRRESGPAAAR